MDLPDRHVEWSTNEKVAFEIAAGAAWAGQRALVTMKMTGVNVAYDALISIAYSGTNGGFVIYVADDPGVSAGMAEQDSRGLALMADLPMLEPADAAEAYELIQTAFELSEAAGTPVFVRLTTAVALSRTVTEIHEPISPKAIDVILEKNIARYTKAGSKICKEQHAALIERLKLAGRWITERGLNRLTLSEQPGGLGVVSVGAVSAYLQEALDAYQPRLPEISTLRAVTTGPFPVDEAKRLLEHCGTILVLEELEPHVERGLIVLARETGFDGPIVGKLDGTLSRIGEYGVAEVLKGLHACGMSPVVSGGRSQDKINQRQESAQSILESNAGAGSPPSETSPNGDPSMTGLSSTDLAAPRPITVCAGCPHRGTYLAIEAAIKQAGFKKEEVMVTGDIGCTILGMNPPFNLLWNEVSMGSSVSLAQGYVHAGIATPVIATIGDSTFFHGGIPGLLNAIQHNTPLTLVIMDNGWTSMTGMQVNAGTDAKFQPEGGRRIDLARIIPALGVDRFVIADPFELGELTDILADCLTCDGVKVVLARQECAIEARRRGLAAGRLSLDLAKCVLCKQCLRITACPALSVGETSILVDIGQCYGCGICTWFCPTGALGNSRGEPRELLGEASSGDETSLSTKGAAE